MTPNPLLNVEHSISFAEAQTGKQYEHQRPISPTNFGFDCSALVIASIMVMYQIAGLPVPADLLKCSNTVDLWYWAKAHGWLVPVQHGVWLRGAIMLKGRWWGYGNAGHTSWSLGSGQEMAAHGTHSGIHPGFLNASEYQDAIVVSDWYYPQLGPIVDPEVLKVLAAMQAWEDSFKIHDGTDKTGQLVRGMTNNRVTFLNELLIAKALLLPHFKSNTYTDETCKAINHMKRIYPEIFGMDKDGTHFGYKAAKQLLARVI